MHAFSLLYKSRKVDSKLIKESVINSLLLKNKNFITKNMNQISMKKQLNLHYDYM